MIFLFLFLVNFCMGVFTYPKLCNYLFKKSTNSNEYAISDADSHTIRTLGS